MKDEDGLIPTTTAKKETSDSSFFGKGRYKFWALAAILLLAFWSMFTGTVTLRWSAGNLNRFTEDLDNYIHDDLDVLVRLFFFFFWVFGIGSWVRFWLMKFGGFGFGFVFVFVIGNGGEREGGEAHVGCVHE